MKKSISILVIGILIISGLGAAAGSEDEKDTSMVETISFSQPILHEKDDFVSIDLPEATSDSWKSGKPKMPVVTKVYTFPFGTHVDSVDVTFSEAIKKKISKPIEPSPVPIMKSTTYTSNIKEPKTSSYSDIDIYPELQYNYRTAAGLNGEEHVIYLIVSLFPVQYKPNENLIYYCDKSTIEIKYTPPKNPVVFPDTYDLLIIAPEEFSKALQKLVDHKNSIGIETKLTTLEEIPSTGSDDQESIKYYIKDAIEDWGITYLLLVGAGFKQEEIFPVRYAWIGSGQYESKFPSDLYYADIYDGNSSFSDWDFDGDNNYAEYPVDMPAVDVIPDVYLGKLPANDVGEVKRL